MSHYPEESYAARMGALAKRQWSAMTKDLAWHKRRQRWLHLSGIPRRTEEEAQEYAVLAREFEFRC